ncbi:small heat shock protein, putative [Plasmodium reichenowi]|uniref:Small heat shock protein, putative n=1 Tax=Plasmodium reichenowi TaxID=5854 RepID=A0A151L6J9_PLARE|nr:small heat shock protein, putative [Plasmodium reichenowi]KYN94487.1 small heat shock protein, putative [Plasmodium reichenowi]SOV81684.1 small heat shock protein, putative [Plasmodium reichenowi]
MSENNLSKDNNKNKRNEALENAGMLDTFFESMYDHMNRLDQYHSDMNRMMNSLRGYYMNNDFFRFFPNRRSLTNYDINRNRNHDLLLSKPFSSMFRRDGYSNVPAMDVLDKEKHLEIKMDVPGLNKEDVQINLDDGKLEISGEFKKSHEQKDEQQRYYIKERCESSFYRSFTLPENVSEDEIKATFKDGVLKIDIPKKDIPDKKKKKIEID